ncbi:MAG: sigma-70 family RNA polymerase sigma factor [Labilithrix sp.]|nr:sigma-70 family RNA polymerase sigma factor [Labilithrix sp.]
MSEGHADADLLRRIAEGDVRAVGELYDRYGPTLFPIALRILRERSEAEDILHDAFVAVNERAHQYASERGSVIAWLVTLVRNLSIDRMRRRERRGALAREVLPHEPPASVRDPEQLTSEAGERAKIRRALANLPDAQRQTLEVAFFEGLSYPEIAARENVPLGTIKSRAARALAALREALVQEGVVLDAATFGTGTGKSG